jgi:hypothetical protein
MSRFGGAVHSKDGFVHRNASWALSTAEVARCGVRKKDGYAIHSAGKFVTCPACKVAPVKEGPFLPKRPNRNPFGGKFPA